MKNYRLIFLLTSIALLGFTVSLNNEMCLSGNPPNNGETYDPNGQLSILERICIPDGSDGINGPIGIVILIGLIAILVFSIMIILHYIIEYRKYINIENQIKNFCDLESNFWKLLISYVGFSVLITVPTVIILLSYTTGVVSAVIGLEKYLPSMDFQDLADPEEIVANFMIYNFGYVSFAMFAFGSLWIFLLRITRKSFRNDGNLEKKKEYPGTGKFVKYFYASYILVLPTLLFQEIFSFRLYHYELEMFQTLFVIILFTLLAACVIFLIDVCIMKHVRNNQSSSGLDDWF